MELGEKTGYKIRIGENAGSQLMRVFLSTIPRGTRDCARQDGELSRRMDGNDEEPSRRMDGQDEEHSSRLDDQK